MVCRIVYGDQEQEITVQNLASALSFKVSAEHTAGIISLLTHVCISVALNIVVHPKLTYEHESACHQ